MDKRRISVASVEYVRALVAVKKDGAVYDPTSDAVAFAFTAGEDLTGATWFTGSWETDAETGKHYARCLIGPSANVVAKGTYVVHVKVTDTPQVPAIKAGLLTVY